MGSSHLITSHRPVVDLCDSSRYAHI